MQSKLIDAQKETPGHGDGDVPLDYERPSELQWSSTTQSYQRAAMNEGSSIVNNRLPFSPSPELYQPDLPGLGGSSYPLQHRQLSPYPAFPTSSVQRPAPSPPSTNMSGHESSSSGLHAPMHGTSSSLPNVTASQVFAGNVDVDIQRELQSQNSHSGNGFADVNTEEGSYDLIFSGWNPDLPEPRLLHHL